MIDPPSTALLDLDLKAGQIMLPNGCCLYWQENEVGGRRYFSDEIGGGVEVWDTSLVDNATLLTAMTIEHSLCRKELIQRERLANSTSNIPVESSGAGDARPSDVQQEGADTL